MSVLNLPNLLSLCRLLISPQIPMAFLMQHNPLWFVWDGDYRAGAFILAVALALTDLLDGALAKLMRQKTHLGRWLDPIADFSYCGSLFVSVFIIYVYSNGLFFAWLIFAGHFAGYAATVTKLRMTGSIGSPNIAAKIAMCLLMTSLLLVVMGTFAWPYYVSHISAVIMIMGAIYLTFEALDRYKHLRGA